MEDNSKVLDKEYDELDKEATERFKSALEKYTVEATSENVKEILKEINFLGKKITYKDMPCLCFNRLAPQVYDAPRIDFFIQTGKKCNAKCKFCVFHGDKDLKFNYKKLDVVLQELETLLHDGKISLGKVDITGGETTYNIKKLEKILYTINQHIKPYETDIVMHTNGYQLKKLSPQFFKKVLTTICISRHHYDDEKNKEIFGTDDFIKYDDLKGLIEKYQGPLKFQMRCNMITGYIDSKEEIKKYLEHIKDLNINCSWDRHGGGHCGFVGLMPMNKYCRDHLINYKDIVSENDPEIIMKKTYNKKDLSGEEMCRCGNFVYDKISFFTKLLDNPKCDYGPIMLVYDGKNLRLGFDGEIIF